MIVFLAGPIEHWWDENWNTPEHWLYAEWRDLLSKALVARGHLVYRPHEAFKGTFVGQNAEEAQSVNDRALEIADVVVVSNLDPPVPCAGTDAECAYLTEHSCKARLVRAAVPAHLAQLGVLGSAGATRRNTLRSLARGVVGEIDR